MRDSATADVQRLRRVVKLLFGGMDVIGAKVLAGFLFFFLAMFFGWMPFWCFRRCTRDVGSRIRDVGIPGTARRAGKKLPIVQCLHSMAAGVLIATCLLSLLPESLEAVRDAVVARQHGRSSASKYGSNLNDSIRYHQNLTNVSSSSESEEETDHYPVAELLVALGFMFIYIVDSTIKSFHDDGNKQIYQDDDSDDVTVLFQRNKQEHFTQQSRNRTVAPQSGGSPEAVKWTKPRFSGTKYKHLVQVDQGPDTDQRENKAVSGSGANWGSDSDRRPSMSGSESGDSKDLLSHTNSSETHPVPSVGSTQRPAKSNQLRALALVTALCIHGFFDGVMLGLQTSQSVIMSLLFALALHKSFVAIGLSLTLLSSEGRHKHTLYMLLYIFLFASVAPLGLLLSAAFVHKSFDTSDEHSIGIAPGSLQAFAVGTFMYVTFTETTERHQQKEFLTEVVSHVFLLVGFALMAGLRAAIGDA